MSNQSENEGKIHKAIVAVMREIGAIGKDSENVQQKYKYRSVEDVYNRVQPLFAKHGIFSYPKVIAQARETGKTKAGGEIHYAILTVEYTFAAEDGSCIPVTVVGEGMDSGDKASNKAMAAAHKYAICQVLNIPYQVIDPDAFAPRWADKLSDVMNLKKLNELKKLWADLYKDDLAGMDQEAMRNSFQGWVMNALGGPDSDRNWNPNEWSHWRPEEYAICLEAINAETVKKGGEAGG